ncbi:radical SAM protein [candidate division WOR-3 bacterium]|nr:radical SAM protein [candidate division WOR-3 bacterium]
MHYQGTVIRPPSEAQSYILQVTYGCSHNKCTFCPTYLDKPFRVRPLDQVLDDINMAHQVYGNTRRVFLADGNALVLGFKHLVTIIDALHSAFPLLQRIGIYANAQDILQKTDTELKTLFDRDLSIIYLGLESGSNAVLKRVKKGATPRQMIDAVHKAQAAGIKISTIALLGLGGIDLGEEHAIETGKAISAMNPRYLSLLTLMVVPGTPLYEEMEHGAFTLPGPLDMLKEMRMIIEHIDVKHGCIFRSNHASNYLPLAGTLPKDKEKLINTIDQALRRGESYLRPEWSRGL